MQPGPRPEDVFSVHMPRAEVEGHIYVLQMSEGRGFRVIYTRNKPNNHDSCNIYANRLVQRRHFFTKWCICDIYYLRQHRAMAAISVYIIICTLGRLIWQ